jgi:hypothetical protein
MYVIQQKDDNTADVVDSVSGNVALTLSGTAISTFSAAGGPASGTGGALAGIAGPGSQYYDTTNGLLYFNEGTLASPYWSPVSFDQPNLYGVSSQFNDQAGKAVANTDAEAVIPGSGIRVFGQGVTETDSGAVAQAAAEGGIVMRLTTTNEAAHLIAMGMDAGVYQPDTHGMMVIDVELTNVSAITARAMFCGFLGTAADALDPAVTGATTVATLVQDDLCGLWFDSGLTDADALHGVHNKSDEAATQDLTADTLDTATNIAAAGTYQRLRVEVDADGTSRMFVDKTLVYTNTAALDDDEEVSPVFYLESNAAATKSCDVRRFSCWAAKA